MNLKKILLAVLLTNIGPLFAGAQGLNFGETFEGKVIVSKPTTEAVQIDFSGNAARGIYEFLQGDSKAEKLVNRNPRGEVVEDVLRNSSITCSSSRLFESYSCQTRIIRE